MQLMTICFGDQHDLMLWAPQERLRASEMLTFSGHEERGVIIGKDLNPIIATIFTHPQPTLSIPGNIGGVNEFTQILSILTKGGSQRAIRLVNQDPVLVGIGDENGPVIINKDAGRISVFSSGCGPFLQRRAV